MRERVNVLKLAGFISLKNSHKFVSLHFDLKNSYNSKPCILIDSNQNQTHAPLGLNLEAKNKFIAGLFINIIILNWKGGSCQSIVTLLRNLLNLATMIQ